MTTANNLRCCLRAHTGPEDDDAFLADDDDAGPTLGELKTRFEEVR